MKRHMASGADEPILPFGNLLWRYEWRQSMVLVNLMCRNRWRGHSRMPELNRSLHKHSVHRKDRTLATQASSNNTLNTLLILNYFQSYTGIGPTVSVQIVFKDLT